MCQTQQPVHTILTMKPTRPMLTGMTLLLLGLLITGFNFFFMNNVLYGGVGIFCVVAGVAMALIGSVRKH